MRPIKSKGSDVRFAPVLEEYVRITFAKGEHGTLEGKTVVDVKKNVEVDLKDNAPEVKPADS